MTSSVSNIGINIGGSATSPVSFSTLRNTFFRETPTSVTPTGTVSASQLLRTTDLPASGTQSNPIVPDATENSNIVTTQSNWRVSHFQQSVKWYNVIQSGTDLNYSIDAQSWNSNLTKNVVKRCSITGTTGSNSKDSPASTFSASAYNFIIEVSGSILGYGGRGGGLSAADPTGTLLPFQRYFSVLVGGLHFYSANPPIEFITQNGYVLENTTAFYIYTTQVTNTVPLYRAYNPTGPHILTTDQTEYNNVIAAGWTAEGVVGYVYSSLVTGTVPVYRAYNSTTGDFFYTTSSTEITNAVSQSGYTNQGTAFYAPIKSISGEAGGDALEVTSSTGRVIVNVFSTGKIYGGGGGGEKGATGADGTGGTCTSYYQISTNCQETAAPDCNSLGDGWYQTRSWNDCCLQRRGCAANYWYRTCRRDTPSAGGVGGEGGDGGPGRGYNNQSGSLEGAGGAEGAAGGGCGATDGLTGDPGGSGGDWGNPGGNTTNTGNGGPAGRAIFGSNYGIAGSTGSANIK